MFLSKPCFHSFKILLAVSISVVASPVHAASLVDGVSTISDADVRQSAIAFINTSTSPGLEGATLTVDKEDRQSTQWRASLGFGAEFTLRDHIFNGYWGIAAIGGSLTDKIDIIGDAGQPVALDLTRNVAALRGSLGLSFPINQYFKLRPYLSLVVSDLRSNTKIDGLIDDLPSGPVPARVDFDSTAQILSTIGTIDALYSRWYGDNRLELAAQYNLIYTDVFSPDNPVLSTIAWNHTAQFKSRYSGPTGLTTDGRFWRWNGYANYTTFMSQNTLSLGYKNFFEVGAGLEWEMNIKPFDWFGWQSVGLRAGAIIGRDIDGFNVGLTAR